jgi:hypothetical protein
MLKYINPVNIAITMEAKYTGVGALAECFALGQPVGFYGCISSES